MTMNSRRRRRRLRRQSFTCFIAFIDLLYFMLLRYNDDYI